MRVSRPILIVLSTLNASPLASGQCLYDADGDGHPLFQPLNHRVDVEFIDDVKMISRPTDMAFGDLDGDGDLDGAFAMAQAGPPEFVYQTYMTLALNRGDGAFDPPTPYLAGREVCGVALGDVDGDGDLDVAVANAFDNSISVFLNRGDSVLGPESLYPVGSMPRSLHVVDLNGDGLADIATLNVESDDVSVLLAIGDGALAPEVRADVGVVTPRAESNPNRPVPGPFMDAADLDADGDLDLAIPSNGEIRILRNDGAGGLTLDAEAAKVAPPNDAYDVVAADVSADGRTDLVAVAMGDPEAALSVVLQEPDGSWADPVAYSGNFLNALPGQYYKHLSIDAGDTDADGDLDLVVGEAIYGFVGVYENKGDGTYKDFAAHATYEGPWVVKLEDLTGDAILDIAQLQNSGQRRLVRIHPGDGTGSFTGPTRSPETGEIECFTHHALTVADLDLDGDLDAGGGFFNTSCSDVQIAIYENDGSGEFTVGAEVSLVPFEGGAIVDDLAVADMNGDGLPDVVAADLGQEDLEIDYPGSVWVLLNDRGFAFQTPLETALETKPYRVTLADFDNDGDIDAAAAAESLHPGNGVDPVLRIVEILLNEGSGALMHSQSILLEGNYNTNGIRGVIANADLDADGDPDLLATVCSDFEPSRLIRLDNDGEGSFTIVDDDFVGYYPSSIEPGDFDLDGDEDVALLYNKGATQALGYEAEQEPYLTIYHNESGVLSVVQEHADLRVRSKWGLDAADFNGDGYPDLAMDVTSGGFVVQLNNGDGTFASGVGYDQLEFTGAQAVGDFTGDGRPDILGAALNADGVLMLLENESCPPCPADVNHDGELTILDFVAFQLLWQVADPGADCDDNGTYDMLDFVCFQQRFQAGCP